MRSMLCLALCLAHLGSVLLLVCPPPPELQLWVADGGCSEYVCVPQPQVSFASLLVP